jgi:hypothetical protein
MNKGKKATIALREYLGRDREALNLLTAIERFTNEQRKALAEVKESFDLNRVWAKELREKSDSERAESEGQKREIERQKLLIIQAESKIKLLEAKVEKLSIEEELDEPPSLELTEKIPGFSVVDSDDLEILNDWKTHNTMLKVLRKEIKRIPEPLRQFRSVIPGRNGSNDSVALYNLHDLILNSGPNELTKLGRFVVSMALVDFPVAFCADPNFITMTRSKCKLPKSVRQKHFDWMHNLFVENRGTLPRGERRSGFANKRVADRR